jgi:hypothetical protein
MHIWIIFALIGGLGMLGYNLCAKFGGGQLPPPVFAGIMYAAGSSAVLPIFLWYVFKQPEGYLQNLPLTPVLFSIGAGLVVVIVDLSVSRMFNLDAPVGLSMTIIYMLSIALTAVIGYFFLTENYSIINMVGLVLAGISIPLIFYGAK